MTNLKLSGAALAVFAAALSLGTVPASALTCDGSWQKLNGHRSGLQEQCYFLPTVSNGRVTGVERKENIRRIPGSPAAVIGGTQPGPYYHPKPK